MAPVREYYAPVGPEEAVKLSMSLPNPRFLAGGTDLLLRIRNLPDEDISLVSLKKLDELKKIVRSSDSTFFIGAMATLDTIEHEVELNNLFPALTAAAAAVGSPSLRVTATIGGNICNASPSADLAPALLVYDARAVVLKDGKTGEIPLSEFFTGPGTTKLGSADLLTGFTIPVPAEGSRSAFLKHSRSRGMDIAAVNTAACVTVSGGLCTGARIAVGAAAPTPMRVPDAEGVLEGTGTGGTAGAIEKATAACVAAISPIDDIRSSAEYRKHIAGVLVNRLLNMLLTEDAQGGER